MNTCLTEEGMGTKNLLINEKACARNCMVHAFTMRKYLDSFSQKSKSDNYLGYNQTLNNSI